MYALGSTMSRTSFLSLLLDRVSGKRPETTTTPGHGTRSNLLHGIGIYHHSFMDGDAAAAVASASDTATDLFLLERFLHEIIGTGFEIGCLIGMQMAS